MAMQDHLPWPPPAPPAPPRPGRRRKMWLLTVAGIALVGLVIGLVVWAPWNEVPVPPAAVHVQSPTATSVLVSWTPSKGGSTVDHYLVLRDGTQVGSVPASQTSFTDSGLTPGSTHKYTIIATSGSQRSSASVKAQVTTITPSPVGLAAGQVTWTSVQFHWTPSPKGPVPDSYVIYNGSNTVAYVTGATDQYSISGLSPGTPYQYQVVARWGSHASSRSAALSVSTLSPPLSGQVPVNVDTVSTPGGGASLSVGQKWSDTWSFTSTCSATSCTLTTDAEFAVPGFSVQPFTMTLTSSGGGYAGSAKAQITKCESTNAQNTVTLHINANNGAVNNGGWNAWTGTMVLSSPYMTSGNYYCPQQSWNFKVTGTNS